MEDQEGIKFEIKEIEKGETEYCDILNKAIPDDAICVGVIIKCEEREDDLPDWINSIGFSLIRDYLVETFKCKIIASTAGIHINGKREKRHIHYNFIMEKFKIPSNNSKSKKAYLNKVDGSADADFCDNENYKTSFKFEALKLDKPKYMSLCYPLKESVEVTKQRFIDTNIFKGVTMKKEMLEFLKSVGNTIYQTEKAINERRDKHDEKIKNQLTDLMDFGKSQKFDSMEDFRFAINTVYLRTIPFGERPNSRNLSEYIKQVGFELGLCDLV